MQKGELSFQQIYNQLLAGKQLVLYFPDQSSAENFRTRMHHHKTKQERVLESLGFASEDERTVLNFKVKRSESDDAMAAYVAFRASSPLKKYSVIILDETDTTSQQPRATNDAQISASMDAHS